MKIVNVILLLAAGIVLGILVQKYVLTSSEALSDVVEPTPIEREDAQVLVTNYAEAGGAEYYYYLSDELFNQLIAVKSSVNSGTGFVVRFGATTESPIYDVAIYSRFGDDLNEIETYFQAPMSKSESDMCPLMCDINSPIYYP